MWASELHREQVRKGGQVPYIAHLLAVTAFVLEGGGDEDEAIAAVLHDAVEDQGGAETRAAIVERFGERVAEIVDGCTDSDETPKPPWRARKTAFIESLATASTSVRLVVAADKLHNATCTLHDLREHGPAVWDRFRGRENAMWYYRSILDALWAFGPNRLVRQFEMIVSELDTL
ncbi:MAG: HD domain-containing protein [Bryobacterales bacterium]